VAVPMLSQVICEPKSQMAAGLEGPVPIVAKTKTSATWGWVLEHALPAADAARSAIHPV
jgi:hypothetical protein